MEEIWKDIPNLSSIQNPNNSFDAMKLQDFLARPFLYPNYNLNLNPVFPSTPAEINLFPAVHASPVCSNNGVLLRPQGNSLSSHHPVSSMTSTQQHLGLGMQSGGSARKRTAVPFENYDQNNGSSCSDRRYQRLIKNRESAARSRDRKEVCTCTQLTFLRINRNKHTQYIPHSNRSREGKIYVDNACILKVYNRLSV